MLHQQDQRLAPWCESLEGSALGRTSRVAIWHDWEAGRAQLVEVAGVEEPPVQHDGGYFVAYSRAGDPVSAISDWKEEHWLVPGLEALFDGTDLDQSYGL